MPTNTALLGEPVSPEAPCGVDLEDTQLLASFDAFRVFGSDVPLRPDMEWSTIRDQALAALGKSKDLRLLAHLAAATLRVDGIVAFCEVLTVADRWLAERWELVFPRVEDDALLRKNALSCFADPMAVVAPLRRSPIVTPRRFGPVCLRDIDLITGHVDAAESDANKPDAGQVEAALAASTVAELSTLVASLARATHSLDRLVANMQQHVGSQSTPDFSPLAKPLIRIRKVLDEHLVIRIGTNSAASEALAVTERPDTTGDGGATLGTSGGEIKSRQDAIRAIDAVVSFFRRNEPSSPVPLLLERAKRLVSKSFLEALADIAPEGLPQARVIGGIRPDGEVPD